MCGIIASYDKTRLMSMIEKNAYRGQHSFSLHQPSTSFITRCLGSVDPSLIPNEGFTICHIQAPTTESKGIESIHPAEFQKNMLWHNGIIKSEYVKRLQVDLNTSETWDTKLILNALVNFGWECLDEIEGSFACIFMSDGEYYIFRNAISPLFINSMLDISSTKLDGFDPIPQNTIFKIDFSNGCITKIQNFNNLENPYYFR